MVFVGAAIVAGAGGFYFFGVYQPNQARGVAAEQIAFWEQRYDKARACLLGDKPASPKTSEAMAIHELTDAKWNRTSCTKLVGELTRGDQYDTGIAEVEAAWERLDEASRKVAKAFVARVDTGPGGIDADALPAALDALDAARAELRAAAQMDPPPTAGGQVLPAAEIVPVAYDGKPVAQVETVLAPSMNTVVALGPQVEMLLTAGQPPRVARVQPHVQRSVADSAWGIVAFGPDDVQVGAIDPEGHLTGGTDLQPAKAKPKKPAANPNDDLEPMNPPESRPLFAVGGAADGVAVAIVADDLVIARVTAGKVVVEKPIDIDDHAFAAAPNGRGRAAIAWADPEGGLHATLVRPGLPTKIVDLGSGHPDRVCVTATHAWVATDADEFFSIDEAGIVMPHVLDGHDLVGCTEKAALIRDNGARNKYVVCKAECTKADIRSTNANAWPALAGDEVVSISTRGNVIGVFRQRGEPSFYAMPAAVGLHFAQATTKVVDVLAHTTKGATIIRVPL
ncbi:MAG TPA: hypothetical protein VFQ53_37385 [Kofleriaceae bacterium]|nr:hypothetical protein [Kofleriaceae bacterium]